MPDLNAVLKHLADYLADRIPLLAFEDRFREDSRGAYAIPRFDDFCSSIESLLSDYHFGEGVDEKFLRQQMAVAVRPFVPRRISADNLVHVAVQAEQLRSLLPRSANSSSTLKGFDSSALRSGLISATPAIHLPVALQV